MKQPRNPFKLRASEHIESDETFVRLFSPDVLTILNHDEVWNIPQVIRSAPGGGKTSLFRLFTPKSLLSVYALRTREYSKDLYRCLVDIDALSEDGPKVLGLLLSCAQSYSTLDDLDIEDTKRRRLLFSLLNARIALTAIHNIATVAGVEFPSQLNRIMLAPPDIMPSPNTPLFPCTGDTLYAWAQALEKDVCDALDSFLPLSDMSLPGHDSLLMLRCLKADAITIDGKPFIDRILLMLDDIHRLTPSQRRLLLDEIIASRPSISVWIAERFEALAVDELLSSGAVIGRDYGKAIPLEEYWRSSASSKRFERMVLNIADRRARDAKDVEIGSFTECLQDSLDGPEWQSVFLDAVSSIAERVHSKVQKSSRYDEWIKECERTDGSPREKAIVWRSMEILIDRDLQRTQQAFDFISLDSDDLEQRDKSGIHAAAELFLNKEFGIPYYYGVSRLATMASSNIEQFLCLAGELFEESVSSVLLKQSAQLSPKRQEELLKRAVKGEWRTIPERVKAGRSAIQFLGMIGTLANQETYRPTAPYAPGVTGIAILMSDKERLSDPEELRKEPVLMQLAQILSTCIANNLLEVTLHQRCKGRQWMVLYLNRMLCIHYGLPLHYGGFREQPLKKLAGWVTKSMLPGNQKVGLFE